MLENTNMKNILNIFITSFILLAGPAWGQSKPGLKDNDLIEAAREGNLYGIIMAMDSGFGVNDRGRYRIPPIVVAADAGQVDAVRLLIQKGAQIDLRAHDNQTALGAAVARERADIVKVLLDAGADPNRSALDKEMPLIVAARKGLETIVRLLVKAGADRYETDRTGRTAMDWAKERRMSGIVAALSE